MVKNTLDRIVLMTASVALVFLGSAFIAENGELVAIETNPIAFGKENPTSNGKGGQMSVTEGENLKLGDGESIWNIQVLDGNLRFVRGDASANPPIALQIGKNGTVGIGTTRTRGALEVHGTIRGKEIKVSGIITAKDIRTTDWGGGPDYVFEKSYEVPALEDVEKYVKVHKHLPDMPSAGNMSRDGVDISSILRIQLRKIEELTLYVIGLNKENLELKKRLALLEARVGADAETPVDF